MSKPNGRVNKGTTIPYGTLAGASNALLHVYYDYGYKDDSMLPELPCPPHEDPQCHSLEEDLYKKEMVGRVDEALNTLSPRAKAVLCLRFGIGLTDDYTLEEIGTRFSVTRERVRQIELKAVRDLRQPRRTEILGQI